MRRGAIQGFIDDSQKKLRDEPATQTRDSGMANVFHKIYRNGVDSGYQICISFMPSRHIRGYVLKLVNENCTLAMLEVSCRLVTKLGESGAISAKAWYYSWASHCDQIPYAETWGERVTYRLTKHESVDDVMKINYESVMIFFLSEHRIRVDHIPEPPFREPK